MSVMDEDLGVASPVLVVDGYVSLLRGGEADPGRLSAARWRIIRWAESRGWRIACMFHEAPGRSPGRPGLEEALARVESGESDGIVTTGLRDIGASLEDVLIAIERVQAAGGAFASVREGIDLTTPTGPLMLRLLLTVREW